MIKVMGWLAALSLGGCATAGSTTSEGADAACATCGGDDVRTVDAAPADASPATERCTPSDWALEPIDGWNETVVISPVHPTLRLSTDGAIDVSYLPSPYSGGPRRRGHRAATGGWLVEEVPGTAEGNLADAITSDGTEHACFTERSATGRRLVCAQRQAGDAWQSMVVDATSSVGVSLTVAPDDTLYLLYSDVDSAGLAIRSPTGAWTVAPLGLDPLSPLAVDAVGCLHAVVDSAPPSTALEHAVRCGDADWALEPVTATTNNPTMSARSIAIDDAGVVHFLFVELVDGPTYHLFYARRAVDGVWTVVEIPGDAELHRYSPSIAIGPDGTAHAVYQSAAPGDSSYRFHHLRLSDPGAVPESFGPASPYGGTTALAIDTSSTLHVVLDHGAKRLDYAHRCPP